MDTLFNVLFSGATALSQATFGEGTVRIGLTNVQCTVNERVLMNCTASTTTTSCTHSQDAGVRCNSGQICLS